MKAWAAMGAGSRAAALVLGAGAVTGAGWLLWPAQVPQEMPQEAAAAPAAPAVAGAGPVAAPVAAVAPAAEPAAVPVVEPPVVDVPLAPVILTWAVTPEGDATIAGTAEAGAMVQVLIDGGEVASTRATAGGEFALVTRLAPNPAPSLMTLAAKGGDGRSLASVAAVALGPIAGPAPAAEVAAEVETGVETGLAPAALLLSEAGTTLLQRAFVPDTATGEAASGTAASGTAQSAPSVETVSYTEAGEVQLGGAAMPGAYLRLYLDDAARQELQVPAGGKWLATLADVAPGTYRLRLDQLDAEGQVTGRFEMPFRRETRAALVAAAAAGPHPAAPAGAETAPALPADGTVPVTAVAAAAPAVDGQPESAAQIGPGPITITVQPGHSLWAIAQGELGAGMLYVQVYEANRDKIGDPDLIYPGQVFTLPGR